MAMDPFTAFAFNIGAEPLTAVSLLLNNDVFYLFLIVALVLVAERRNPKRLKIFSALLLAVLFAVVIKSLTVAERPCAQMGLDYCPADYGFPSLHATVAFTLMVSFLNKRSYWFFMAFAIFVSFTRLVLAVHLFIDIAAALPLALISYYMVDVLWRRYFHEAA